MNTGFLLPRSVVYPLIAFDFLDGCKSFLKHTGMDTNITTDSIGFGHDEKEVYSKTEAMLMGTNPDVVVAFIDSPITAMLEPLFSATGKILIVVNMGLNYPGTASATSTLIHHSFNLAFNCRLTGKLAAAEKQGKAIIATSFYDGGYLHCFAMAAGYQQAGGIISHNFVTNYKKEEFTTAPLEEYYRSNPDENKLLCLYSGDVSDLFYKAAASLQQEKEINLYVSPMMLDESLKDILGPAFQIKNTKGYTSWVSSLENESNGVFKKQFEGDTGRKPGIFSLLGWETGILLQQISQLAQNGLKGSALVQQLKKVQPDSPRGWLKTDDQTNQTFSPSYLVSLSGNFDLSTQDGPADIDKEWTEFNQVKPEGHTSGWRNTYLCS